MTDKPTMTTILEPLLAYLREGNNQTRINEVLSRPRRISNPLSGSRFLAALLT